MNNRKIPTSKEMFPDLLGDESNRDRYIEFLLDSNERLFVRKALEKADYTLTDKDLQLCEIVLDDMIYRDVLQDQARQQYIDVMLIAAMLRNCYKDPEHPITSLFKIREEFGDLEHLEEYGPYGMPQQFFEQIYQLIEGQNGEETRVHFCKPTVGSIHQMFVDCIRMQDAIYKYPRVGESDDN